MQNNMIITPTACEPYNTGCPLVKLTDYNYYLTIIPHCTEHVTNTWCNRATFW